MRSSLLMVRRPECLLSGQAGAVGEPAGFECDALHPAGSPVFATFGLGGPGAGDEELVCVRCERGVSCCCVALYPNLRSSLGNPSAKPVTPIRYRPDSARA